MTGLYVGQVEGTAIFISVNYTFWKNEKREETSLISKSFYTLSYAHVENCNKVSHASAVAYDNVNLDCSVVRQSRSFFACFLI